ncbi:hypothetical protein [Mycolicibacterium peregrinum]|uniref:hypothetical protein n=1 Tax=Mycolicibacterium peregrinum TaxID=43304 RepID=UPI003AABEEA7
MTDDEMRIKIEAHWASSDVNDFDAEHRAKLSRMPNVSRSIASSAAVICGSASWY